MRVGLCAPVNANVVPQVDNLPSADQRPSQGAVLLLAGLAGACWLATALGVCLTAFAYLTRNEAHGAMEGLAVLFGFFTVATLVIAIVFGVYASSKLEVIAKVGSSDAT